MQVESHVLLLGQRGAGRNDESQRANIQHCVPPRPGYCRKPVNSEYVKQALAKVGNPNVLVNLISRRVRQLTSGGGSSRPLIDQAATMGAADVALLEIIEGKMDFVATTAAEEEEEVLPVARKRRRSSS
jgi:DNA-directed RNA polymerase subunit omega